MPLASGRAWVRRALPVSQRDQARQFLDPGLERIGDLQEQLAALARRHARPGGIGRGRGLDGAIDVLGAPARNFGDRPAVRRVLDQKDFAGGAVDPFSADQHLRLLERRRFAARRRHCRHDRLHHSSSTRCGRAYAAMMGQVKREEKGRFGRIPPIGRTPRSPHRPPGCRGFPVDRTRPATGAGQEPAGHACLQFPQLVDTVTRDQRMTQ